MFLTSGSKLWSLRIGAVQTEQLGRLQSGYLHIIEGQTGGSRDADQRVDFADLRQSFKKAFGVPFLANPDPVSRFRHGHPLNTPDQATYYGGAEKGYTDYPA